MSLRSRRAVALTLALCLSPATPSLAYMKLGTGVNGQTVSLQWPARTPVRYFIADAGVDGVSAEGFRQAVTRGFDTWEAVPTASVRFEFAGFIGGQPLDEDGVNVIGFADRPDLERTLASTNFLVDTRTGEIVESDIFFNSAFRWSVAPGGEAGRFDVQSIATHEAGHFLGLGHSLLGETEAQPDGGRRLLASNSVMFPIAFSAGNIVDRDLTPDDIAGVSDAYPDGDFRRLGTLQGTVTKNGRGIFGAHVVAFNARTGALVGGFSLDDAGAFVVAGLEAGTYIVRVEPLDDGDVDSFFEASDEVDADFRAAYYQRLVTVPEGGGSVRIEIEVDPK